MGVSHYLHQIYCVYIICRKRQLDDLRTHQRATYFICHRRKPDDLRTHQRATYFICHRRKLIFFINNSMRHEQPHLLYDVKPDLKGLISVNLNDWNIRIKFSIELEEGGYCCVRGS